MFENTSLKDSRVGGIFYLLIITSTDNLRLYEVVLDCVRRLDTPSQVHNVRHTLGVGISVIRGLKAHIEAVKLVVRFDFSLLQKNTIGYAKCHPDRAYI